MGVDAKSVTAFHCPTLRYRWAGGADMHRRKVRWRHEHRTLKNAEKSVALAMDIEAAHRTLAIGCRWWHSNPTATFFIRQEARKAWSFSDGIVWS